MATDLDPTFALAYARLGIIYNNAQELETSRQFFSKAFELREHATEHERLYITTHHYAGTGEADKLLQVYELWRQLYPRDLIPSNNLVSVYLTLGNLEKAVDAAREAVRLGPNNAFPYMGLVRAYQKTGRFAEAKRAYDEVVARKLDGIVVHLERYVIAFAKHDIAEMQRQLDWAHGKAQEGELLNEAAWGAMANGQTRRARTLFSEAERAGLKNGLPQFAVSGWLDYAQFCSELGLRAEARSSLNKALLSASTSPEFRATAAIVFANIGDLRSADELASTAARQSRLL